MELFFQEAYEKNNKAGGLLRYGIPDFKMEKHIIDRRINQLEEEGIIFKYGINVGTDVTIEDLENNFDAIVLSGGSEHPRDLPVEGRDLDGIHFAMEFLPQQNKRVSNEGVPPKTKEILSLIPGAEIDMIERCSGHDGTYAVKKESHETSIKIRKPVKLRGLIQKPLPRIAQWLLSMLAME